VIFSANVSAMSALSSTGMFDVLGVWAVGTPPTVYPEGTGRWVRKGQMLRTNLHYHPNGTPQVDRTRVGLYFGKGELKKEVAAALAGNVTFSIPPNAPNFELRSVYMVDQDINIVSFFPHMHLRGKDMKMTATFPDGRQQTLLNVPAYDFNWQLFYYPKTTVPLPRGTRVDLVAHYDNSAANKHNPDPSKAVTFGEASTTSEMMFGMFEFTADCRRQSEAVDRARADGSAGGVAAGGLLVPDRPAVWSTRPAGGPAPAPDRRRRLLHAGAGCHPAATGREAGVGGQHVQVQHAPAHPQSGRRLLHGHRHHRRRWDGARQVAAPREQREAAAVVRVQRLPQAKVVAQPFRAAGGRGQA
jgi:hypothetical protein